METNSSINTATLTHLSALTQYFFPFGNFIFPIIIWSASKKNSDYVDHHGRQIINFQLSMFLYTVALAVIAIPILLFTIFKNVPFTDIVDGNENIDGFSPANISGIVVIAIVAVLVWFFMKVAEFFLIINASVQAANGVRYKYPLTINFLGSVEEAAPLEPEVPLEPQQP
ncbi:MAG TPA: DUF4870 domain-containing protein [Flavobacterium sp.]|jgi:hypothetical protein